MRELTGRLHVIDGITGYVGANLARALIDRGDRVIGLTRGDHEDVRRAVDGAVLGVRATQPVAWERLKIVSYELLHPMLGFDAAGLDELFVEPCDYWHVAANVNFRPGAYADVQTINVEGTRHAVEAFAKAAQLGSRFHHVSTAYCCGDRTRQPVEQWYEPAPYSRFRNFYEASKLEAELVVRDVFEREVLTGAVHRLGQVVGDSETGVATTDYGLYGLVRAIWAVAIRRPDAHVRIEAHPEANLHLVPIDATIRWMLDVADAPELVDLDPPVFHILDEDPVPASLVVDIARKHLPMDVRIATPASFEAAPSTQLERIVAARIAYTGSYLVRPFEFGRANLDRLTPTITSGLDEPAIDRMIAHFVASLEQASAAR